MKREELRVVLDKHNKWLLHEEGGEKADLSGKDLSYADFSEANLYGANFSGAKLSGANFSRAKLSEANLSGADLRGANFFVADLRGASLFRADLYGANFSEANLRGASFREANLYGANLFRADLREANLSNADLREANLSNADLRVTNNPDYICPINCLEEGSFIGFKKARNNKREVIVKLRITETAKRSSATSRMCRCSEAEVLSIEDVDGRSQFKVATSVYDPNFIYEVGKIVKVEDFDENRWKEYSTGIHFFITREEAVRY